MLFCSNSAHFSEIQLVCDGRTDGPTDRPTDGPTDRRTDTPSYRDARTHLKNEKGNMKNGGNLEFETRDRSWTRTSLGLFFMISIQKTFQLSVSLSLLWIFAGFCEDPFSSFLSVLLVSFRNYASVLGKTISRIIKMHWTCIKPLQNYNGFLTAAYARLYFPQ